MPIATGRKIWFVALPVIFAELSEAVLHVIDTALVGRVGTTELAALVLADTILEISLVAVIALSEALQIVVARRSGEGEDRSVGATFNRTVAAILLLSIGLVAAVKLVAPSVANLVADSDAVSRSVDRFLQIAAFGLPFLAVSFAYSAFYVGISQTRALIAATVVLALTNSVLGYALVLGKLGAPRLGLEGAAWASVVAELATAAALMAYAFGRRYRRFGLLRTNEVVAPPLSSLAGLAAPIAVYGLIEGAQWLLFFVIIEQLGTSVLAWSNVIYAWLLLLLIPTEALSQLTVSRVSSEIGRASQAGTSRVANQFARHSLVATVPLALLAIVAPEWVFSLFGGEVRPDETAVRALQLVAAGLIVAVPAAIWSSAVHGTGDTVAGAAFDSLGAIVMLAWAFVAVVIFRAGSAVVWAALPVSWAVALAVSYAWIKSGRWRRVTI
ncbi:MAG: MATE family efflux transporter [Actinomycetota bacterium]|nr:MATE family efflux transporter [Actinomycetota bacterium]